MDELSLKLIPAKTAGLAAPEFVPAGDGARPPAADQAPSAYLADLAGAGHLADAAAFLAAALPRREGIWWGCRCLRFDAGAAASKEAEAALVAAEAWVLAPGDVNRRKAMPAAEAAGFGDPAGCLALAAFLSGGSLAPPNLQEVPPPPHVSPRALAGSLRLAAARAEPGKGPEVLRRYLDLGLAVARGEDRWKDPA